MKNKMNIFLHYVYKRGFDLIKDIITTFASLTVCEMLDIIWLLSLGLAISGIYGFYSEPKIGDLILVIGALYGAIKSKRKLKEIEC